VKQAVAAWNLGTNREFALGPRKTTEDLDRVGRCQHLPDASKLLTSCSTLNVILKYNHISQRVPLRKQWQLNYL
jgi:hypothetical protein